MFFFKKKLFANAEELLRNIDFKQEVLGERHIGRLNTKHWIVMCQFEKKKTI